MKKYNRNHKIFIISILVVAVIGLSIGFAAFTNTLIIKSSATVNTDPSTFQIEFSTKETSTTSGYVSGVSSTGAQASSAYISGTTISNLNASFNKPGQSVTYTFYARNTGKFNAYLNSIDYSQAITCVASPNTSGSAVQETCKYLQVTVTVGESSSAITTTTTKNLINGHTLAKNAAEKVVVKIEYKNTSYNDGDFTVNGGDITLTYSTQD